MARLRTRGAHRRAPLFAAVAAVSAALFSLGVVRAADTGMMGDSWLQYGRDLTGQRFSPLQGLTPAAVHGLTLAWKKTLGPPVSMEATPIVSGGVEYVTTGNAAVFALDAATGKTLWSYAYPLPVSSHAEACCNINNRGVTLVGDEVVEPTLDAHLIALDAKTGKVRWNVTVDSNKNAYSITSPPLPVKGLLVTGVGGGEYPTRGFLAAYDAKTGKQVWRTYTIPGPGQPGSETWSSATSASRGGGPTWLPGTYDPERNTIYWGTGNPNPDWDPTFNKGDLLYTSSIIALDASTGKIKWHYQTTPHNIWDYDATAVPMLVDVPMNGQNVAAIAQANRNGYLYLLDRDTGKLIYAKQYLDRVTWADVDPNSGKITLNPVMQALAMSGKPFVTYPSIIGGTNWEPPAYDPVHHVMYIAALESHSTVIPLHAPKNPKAGAFDFGGGFKDMIASGSVTAIDLATGDQLWKRHFRSPNFSGLLATAGGTVFTGTLEGDLIALDAATGKTVWQGHVGSGINAPPIAFARNGREFVSVAVGTGAVWDLFFSAVSSPYLKPVPHGSAIYTFALPAGAAMTGTH